MRVRTTSACVALAWSILLILVAVGSLGSIRQAQANTRIASSTSNTVQVTLTSSVTTTMTRTPAIRPDAGTRARPAASASAGSQASDTTYVVQPGDTLSGIAAKLGVPGGWPALYAANRAAIGSDPALIRPGALLVVPGRATPARYTVAPGDTLSGIAALAGVTGGWPALYAANRPVIGPNPNDLRVGTVLAIPTSSAPTGTHPGPSTPTGSRPSPAQPTAPGQPSGRPSPAPRPTPPASRPAGQAQPAGQPASARPTTRAQAPAVGGLPRWLVIVLAVAGILIAIAFLTEPVLALARRRRAARQARDGHIVLADYERLVVTHSRQDGTVYVLRPPDADPHAILLAARLVLAQDRYEALAGRLGVPAHWPAE